MKKFVAVLSAAAMMTTLAACGATADTASGSSSASAATAEATSGDGYKPEYAAYPLTVGSPSLEWRVTYEDSPVTVLIEDHPFLTTPNKLDETAWDNWVQERSIYVPMEWDEAYEAPIRSGTVEQENREYDGQILTAPYGEGRFTYTALAFFRQVPNLVPGGVKLFTNIISQ